MRDNLLFILAGMMLGHLAPKTFRLWRRIRKGGPAKSEFVDAVDTVTSFLNHFNTTSPNRIRSITISATGDFSAEMGS